MTQLKAPSGDLVKARVRPTRTEDGGWSYRTRDSFANFLSNTGIGTQNLSSGGTYLINPVTRQRMLLEWLYRGNWVARKIVDAPADDMTREGVEIQSEGDDPNAVEQLNKGIEALQVWTRLGKAIKWGRLYGGALAYLMIDGQDPKDPLDLNSVGKGMFKGVLPLDRWMAWPDTTNINSDMSPEFGLPKFYKLWPDVGTGLPIVTLHHSRVIRFDGQDLPYWQRIAENYWGLSVLEPIYDRIMAFDSSTQGAAQLVYKAHLRTIKVKGLRELLGSNDPAAGVLKQFFDYVRLYQANEGLTLLDSEDEFEVSQYAFSGLSDMLLQFAQQLAGASDIPMVRFYAQSPAGMNATGDSDWRNYYDGIKASQERVLRPGVEKIYQLAYRSILGRPPKDNVQLNFRSLWQMTDEQSATVTSSVATAISTLVDKQILTPPMALKELRTLAGVTNFGTSITDEDIEQAVKDDKFKRENPPEIGDVLPDGTVVAAPGGGPGTVGPGAKAAKSGENKSGATNIRSAAA